MSINTINPATAQVIQSYKLTTEIEINSVLDKSVTSQSRWQELSLSSRAKLFVNLAKSLRDNSETYASLITTEMGKPIKQARAEIEKCAWVCEHYAQNAEVYLQTRAIETDHKKSMVTYKPLGIILGVMPWNFPFWQVFRFSVPTMMAGNGVIIKMAENCLGSAGAIQQLYLQAGFPEYLFNHVIIDHNRTANIISDSRITGVSLTGSEQAGSIIGSCAAQHLKKVVLELGGNDPYIILADADPAKAAQICLKSRLNNTGQVCIAAKRFIVVEQVIEQFKQHLLDELMNFEVGDPTIEKYNIGPMARRDLRESLHQQVVKSIELGAKCTMGGLISDENQPGFYYPITLLENIKPGMPAYHEELFGPVISIINAKDEDDAIRIANDSQYGLAAAVFTSDLKKGQYLAENKIQAGTVAVNNLVSSDPRLPFGGIKRSGYGRELGMEGMHEFVNIKTIIVD